MTKSIPLEGRWVSDHIHLETDGQVLQGVVQANWGAIEVTMLRPVAGVTRRYDARGWSFAMHAHYVPTVRYALQGSLTEKGKEAATKMLLTLHQDAQAFAPKLAEIALLVSTTRSQIEQIAKDWPHQPWVVERQRLRRLFKAKELTQQEYQKQLKALDKGAVSQIDLKMDIERDFTIRLMGLCGRSLHLVEAGELLEAIGSLRTV